MDSSKKDFSPRNNNMFVISNFDTSEQKFDPSRKVCSEITLVWQRNIWEHKHE